MKQFISSSNKILGLDFIKNGIKIKEALFSTLCLTLAHFGYNMSSSFQKRFWSSNYFEHFFFLLIQMKATEKFINGVGGQKEAQHSASFFFFLCQDYTPHQRRKYNFADPFRN